MDTYKTLSEARTAKGHVAHCILEIEHRHRGICYIGSKAGLKPFRVVLAAKPHPEIIRIISEHDRRTDEQQAADNARFDAEADAHRKCERCGTHIGRDAYHQIERSYFGKVIAYYCDSCQRLLTQIGTGEHTAMQDRSSIRQDNTPYTKMD